jgi:hypothetical protein
MLSPTQMLIKETQSIVKKKSKCHGNRQLQHFKRKCLARGFNEAEIATVIHKRNHTISE